MRADRYSAPAEAANPGVVRVLKFTVRHGPMSSDNGRNTSQSNVIRTEDVGGCIRLFPTVRALSRVGSSRVAGSFETDQQRTCWISPDSQASLETLEHYRGWLKVHRINSVNCGLPGCGWGGLGWGYD